MADTGIPIQPAATPTPAAAPVVVRTFQQVDEFGNVSQIQAVMLVDDLGRVVQPMTDKTGRDLILAVRALHEAIVSSQGGMYPPNDETLTE